MTAPAYRFTERGDLSGLSTDELRGVQREWYREAIAQELPAKLALIARELGEALSVRYGPKYEWLDVEGEAICIYADDYGHYMTVHVGPRLVCSSHPTQELFVPGPWLDRALAFVALATEKRDAKRAIAAEEERQRQLASLGAGRSQ